MKKGIKFWEGILVKGKKVSIRYDQKRNAFEAVIRKVRAEDGVKKGYLESCMVAAFCVEMEGLGYLTADDYFEFPTGEKPQMDDTVMAYLNDPANDHLFGTGDVMDNRLHSSYPTLAGVLFNCDSFLEKNSTFDFFANQLTIGNGVQAILKDPGHGIALIAYDIEKDEIIYHDSWGTRNCGAPALRNGGRYERLTRGDMHNVKSNSIVYMKKP